MFVDLGLVLQRSLAQVYSFGGHRPLRSWLRSILLEFTGLFPDLQSSLVPAYSIGSPRLAPEPAEVSGSALLPQWLLLWSSLPEAYSSLGHWLRPFSVDVPGLGLLS